MKRLLSILVGVIVAAFAGGILLGVEVGAYTALDVTDVLTVAEALGVGVTAGVIAIIVFAAGLVVIGVPMFLILNRMARLNGVTGAVCGALAATVVIIAFLAAAEIRDASILFGLFLIPPGALAGWLLWRLGFKAG